MMKAAMRMACLACALTACSFGNPARLAELDRHSSEADVRQRFGAPTRIVQHADGGRSFEYSDQPHGNQCYMVRMNAAGKVLWAHDMFSDANIARIAPPMSKREVSEMMCEPAMVSTMRTGEEAWDWNRVSNSGQTGQRFIAYFSGEQLTRVQLLRVVMEDVE